LIFSNERITRANNALSAAVASRPIPSVTEGAWLKRGEPVGYVGSTENANQASPHLHFAIFELTPEKKWWKGRPVNPYPLLRQ
jgi:murein DD-endopeptidase MepM/ murein hydrolase activator NlpD